MFRLRIQGQCDCDLLGPFPLTLTLPKEREQQAPASGDPKRIDGSQPGGTILPLPEGECREGEAFRAFADFDSIFAQRRREADEFYAELQKDIADFGVRAISRTHRGNPYQFHVNGGTMSVEYQPAESNSG